MANSKVRRVFSFFVAFCFFSGILVSQASAASSVKIRIFYDDINLYQDLLLETDINNGYPTSYTSTSTLTQLSYPLGMGNQLVNTSLKLSYFYDFWNGYNIGSDTKYSFYFWFATVGGVGRYISNLTVTLTIGNLSFTGQFGSIDGNGNRSCAITGEFLGSEFLKYGSDKTTFSLSYNLSGIYGTSTVGFWMDSFMTLSSVSSTDQILDGLNSTFGDNYSQPDTSTFDQYEDLESEAMGQIQGGLDDINSTWNNLGGTLGQYQAAFLGFNSFFNKLTAIPWIGSIIIVSVGVGIFALLLGAVGHLSSSYDGGHSDSKKGSSSKNGSSSKKGGSS